LKGLFEVIFRQYFYWCDVGISNKSVEKKNT
jgi:hypothetical protein